MIQVDQIRTNVDVDISFAMIAIKIQKKIKGIARIVKNIIYKEQMINTRKEKKITDTGKNKPIIKKTITKIQQMLEQQKKIQFIVLDFPLNQQTKSYYREMIILGNMEIQQKLLLIKKIFIMLKEKLQVQVLLQHMLQKEKLLQPYQLQKSIKFKIEQQEQVMVQLSIVLHFQKTKSVLTLMIAYTYIVSEKIKTHLPKMKFKIIKTYLQNNKELPQNVFKNIYLNQLNKKQLMIYKSLNHHYHIHPLSLTNQYKSMPLIKINFNKFIRKNNKDMKFNFYMIENQIADTQNKKKQNEQIKIKKNNEQPLVDQWDIEIPVVKQNKAQEENSSLKPSSQDEYENCSNQDKKQVKLNVLHDSFDEYNNKKEQQNNQQNILKDEEFENHLISNKPEKIINSNKNKGSQNSQKPLSYENEHSNSNQSKIEKQKPQSMTTENQQKSDNSNKIITDAKNEQVTSQQFDQFIQNKREQQNQTFLSNKVQENNQYIEQQQQQKINAQQNQINQAFQKQLEINNQQESIQQNMINQLFDDNLNNQATIENDLNFANRNVNNNSVIAQMNEVKDNELNNLKLKQGYFKNNNNDQQQQIFGFSKSFNDQHKQNSSLLEIQNQQKMNYTQSLSNIENIINQNNNNKKSSRFDFANNSIQDDNIQKIKSEGIYDIYSNFDQKQQSFEKKQSPQQINNRQKFKNLNIQNQKKQREQQIKDNQNISDDDDNNNSFQQDKEDGQTYFVIEQTQFKISNDNLEYFNKMRNQYKISDIKIFKLFINQKFLDYVRQKYQLIATLFREDMLIEFRNQINESKKMQNVINNYLSLNDQEKQVRSTQFIKLFESQDPQVLNFRPFFDYFIKFLQNNHDKQLQFSQDVLAISDLTGYHEQYPLTRSMKRKFIYHSGPTNSGKTYEAIQRLSKAKSGLYCAPLRLLAWEVQQKMEEFEEVQCDLLTGQEKIIREGSQITSCTVELAVSKYVQQCEKTFDVAVLDEVQMVGDFERGSNWTSIILGLPAQEIHLCGDPKAFNVIKNIIKQCGDEFEERTYFRRSELVVQKQLVDYKDLQPGDCLIAYSVQKLFEIRKQINQITNEDSCAILYGRLPPQVRKQQANLFNSGQYKYLIATDVVGMGLNFNINRIIFTELKPFNRLQNNQINSYLQIGGRAGRNQNVGYVACTNQEDLSVIQNAFQRNSSYYHYLKVRGNPKQLSTYKSHQIENFKKFKGFIKKVGIFPSIMQIKDLKQLLEEKTGRKYKLSQVVLELVKNAKIEGYYFIQKHLEFRIQSDLIDHLELDIQHQFIFAQAPINLKKKEGLAAQYLIKFATEFKNQDYVQLPSMVDEIEQEESFQSLQLLQDKYNVCELYTWLHYKFPDKFIDLNNAIILQEKIILRIDSILKKL